MNKKNILLFSILFIFSIILPYVLALYFTPEGYTYNGFIRYLHDNSTYLSKMNNDESFVFINKYNHVDQNGWYVFTLYSFLGVISRTLNISAILVFHISRIFFSIVFIYSLVKLLKELNLDVKQYKIVFVLVLFGNTGESILFLLTRFVTGLEVYSLMHIPETLVFPSALFLPHFILSLTLINFTWYYSLKYIKYLKQIDIIKIGILFTLLTSIHPYTVVQIGISIFIFIIIYLKRENKLSFKSLYPLFYMGLIPLPYLLITYIKFNTNLTLVSWMKEAIMFYPHNLAPLIFYGIHLVFILFFIFNKNNWKKENIMLVVWLSISLLFSFTPSAASIRYLEGIGIPFFILLGIWLTKNKIKLLTIIIYIIMFSNSLILIIEPIWSSNKENVYWYIEQDTIESFNWINKNIDTSEVFLSDTITSNNLPAYTKQTVYYGHGHETPSYFIKEEMWVEFTKNPIKQWNSGWIQRNNISYILINKNHVDINLEYLDTLPIEIIYQNSTIRIYRINLKEGD